MKGEQNKYNFQQEKTVLLVWWHTSRPTIIFAAHAERQIWPSLNRNYAICSLVDMVVDMVHLADTIYWYCI